MFIIIIITFFTITSFIFGHLKREKKQKEKMKMNFRVFSSSAFLIRFRFNSFLITWSMQNISDVDDNKEENKSKYRHKHTLLTKQKKVYTDSLLSPSLFLFSSRWNIEIQSSTRWRARALTYFASFTCWYRYLTNEIEPEIMQNLK